MVYRDSIMGGQASHLASRHSSSLICPRTSRRSNPSHGNHYSSPARSCLATSSIHHHAPRTSSPRWYISGSRATLTRTPIIPPHHSLLSTNQITCPPTYHAFSSPVLPCTTHPAAQVLDLPCDNNLIACVLTTLNPACRRAAPVPSACFRTSSAKQYLQPQPTPTHQFRRSHYQLHLSALTYSDT